MVYSCTCCTLRGQECIRINLLPAPRGQWHVCQCWIADHRAPCNNATPPKFQLLQISNILSQSWRACCCGMCDLSLKASWNLSPVHQPRSNLVWEEESWDIHVVCNVSSGVQPLRSTWSTTCRLIIHFWPLPFACHLKAVSHVTHAFPPKFWLACTCRTKMRYSQ